MAAPKNQRWLEPDLLSVEEMAMLTRLANEQHMGVEEFVERLRVEPQRGLDVVEKLDALARPRQPTDPITDAEMVRAAAEALKKKGMPIFKPVVHEFTPPRPDPKPTPLVNNPADVDARLIEFIRTWPYLAERDRNELVLMLRIKIHYNKGE